MVRVLGRSRTCVLPQCSFNARPRRNTLQIHHTREMRRQRRARPLKKHRVVRVRVRVRVRVGVRVRVREFKPLCSS